MAKQLVGYRIPVELRDELRIRAQELNMTMTGYIRYLLLITGDANEKKRHMD